jgi:hypothetical protein
VTLELSSMARARQRRTLAASLALFVAVTAASTATASAEPVARERFHDSSSEVAEDFCGDLTVQIDSVFDGSFLVNARGSDGLIHGAARIHGTETYTNLENDRTITIVTDVQERDQIVTDNGDGTLTIRVATPGRHAVYGPDGRLLFNDAGTAWFEILVDHGGTPTDVSDDNFLEFLGIVKLVGRTDTAGRDFCDDLHLYIG